MLISFPLKCTWIAQSYDFTPTSSTQGYAWMHLRNGTSFSKWKGENILFMRMREDNQLRSGKGRERIVASCIRHWCLSGLGVAYCWLNHKLYSVCAHQCNPMHVFTDASVIEFSGDYSQVSGNRIEAVMLLEHHSTRLHCNLYWEKNAFFQKQNNVLWWM